MGYVAYAPTQVFNTPYLVQTRHVETLSIHWMCQITACRAMSICAILLDMIAPQQRPLPPQYKNIMAPH